jgi:hypothetical protein
MPSNERYFEEMRKAISFQLYKDNLIPDLRQWDIERRIREARKAAGV